MQTPASHAVTRAGPDGTVTIWACPAHLKATIAQLRAPGAKLSVGLANRDAEGNPLDVPVHGCKGCGARWAPMRRTGA